MGTGEKISDEEIKAKIVSLISNDGFPYGYRKINTALRKQFGILINHIKTYRLGKELDILKTPRKIYPKRPRRLAKKQEITGSNQLWEMDIKYGYLKEARKFFYQISIIDVFDRMVVDYYIGLNATAVDASRLLKRALEKRNLYPGSDNLPVIRTDNGPQFMAAKFEERCRELGMIHKRIPVRTPNMNAHIEAFHSILEEECYSCNEFLNFREAYEIISQYIEYYNNRRIHGSLGYLTPAAYYESNISNISNVLKITGAA